MAELYHFAGFVLDLTERQLYADGVPVALRSTDLRLLVALVEKAGSLVPKTELVSRVWGRTAVTDNALYVHVNTLREILGKECIINKQGAGYGLVPPVKQLRKRASSRSDKARSGNLPAAHTLSRLTGRSDELSVASKLLTRNRLLTITGPGGVGKTKFALHAAGKNAKHFPDGVWLVELASLRDPESLITAIAAVLGIGIADKGNPLETLGRHLAQKHLLIVLDNCEHVINAAASLCDSILKIAPGVKILATSREPIGYSAEQVLEISPLALPCRTATDPHRIRGAAAIELFVERASSADADFRMTDKDALIVSRICHRVDGLPLAIEMVAGWTSALGLQTLEAKLDGFIRGWLSAKSIAPVRHSTLPATLEWSHDLLSVTERTVLRRLAVFAGSFSLEAAEAVVSGVDVPSDRIFGFLASLVRKSMVAVAPESQGMRYRLLETTRAFMAEKLALSDDQPATKKKHALYVLHVVECAVADWETISDAAWRDQCLPVIDDLRAALEWATESSVDDAIALAGASWPLWRELSLVAEGWRRLSAAAAQLYDGTPADHEARLRRGLAEFLVNTAAVKSAEAELVRAAQLYRGLGDLPNLGDTLGKLAFMLFVLDRFDEAERTIAEALRFLDASQRPRTVARIYNIQMCIEFRLGRASVARDIGAKAVALCDRIGAEGISLIVAANLVELTLDSGDIDGAVSAGRELRERMRDWAPSDLRGFALGVFAGALTMRSDLDEALTTAREAAPLLYNYGHLLWLFDHLALRAGLAGRLADAALVIGYSDAAHEKNEYPRWPMGSRAAERLRVLLRETLVDDEIARLEDMGSQFSEHQALTLALRA